MVKFKQPLHLAGSPNPEVTSVAGDGIRCNTVYRRPYLIYEHRVALGVWDRYGTGTRLNRYQYEYLIGGTVPYL